MHLGDKDFIALLKSTERPKWLDNESWAQKWDTFADKFVYRSSKELVQLYGDDSPIDRVSLSLASLEKDFSSPADTTKKLKLIVGDFLRSYHEDIARFIVEFGIRQPADASSEKGAGRQADGQGELWPHDKLITGSTLEDAKLKRLLVGLTAQGHRKSTEAMRELCIQENNKFDGYIHGVPVLYLAALLKLADTLDAGEHRAPYYRNNSLLIPSDTSREEVKWNQLVDAGSHRVDQKADALIIDMYTDSNTWSTSTFNALQCRYVAKIQAAINEAQLATTLLTRDDSFDLRLGFHRVETNVDPGSGALDDKILTEPIPLRINPDIAHSLIRPLYGNSPSVAVRELVQNAVDACLLRKRCDCDGDYKPAVSVSVKGDSLTVSDNGVGMDAETLRDYFMTIGSSFRESKSFLEATGGTAGTGGKSVSLRSGRYGIGILAAFLLGEGAEVEVITQKAEAGSKRYRFCFTEEGEAPDVVVEERSDPGTTITVRFPQAAGGACPTMMPAQGDAAVAWDQWYQLSEPEVTYEVEGEPHTPKELPWVPDNVPREGTAAEEAAKSGWARVDLEGGIVAYWHLDEQPGYGSDSQMPEGRIVPFALVNGIVVGPRFDLFKRLSPEHGQGGMLCVSLFDPKAKLDISLDRSELRHRDALDPIVVSLIGWQLARSLCAGEERVLTPRPDNQSGLSGSFSHYGLSKDGFIPLSASYLAALCATPEGKASIAKLRVVALPNGDWPARWRDEACELARSDDFMSVLLYLDCVPGKEDWQKYRRNKDTVRLAGLKYALDKEGWQLFTEELGAGRTVTRYACATYTLTGDGKSGLTPMDWLLQELVEEDRLTANSGLGALWLPYDPEPEAAPAAPTEEDLGLDSEEVAKALALLKEKTGQDWTPLDREGRQVLFVTKDIVTGKVFHAEHRPVASWAGSDLQGYLNGAFCEGWGNELRGMIAKRSHTCRAYPNHAGHRIAAGAATSDEVFALSIDEAQWYFPEWESRRASFDGRPLSWWLRSPGGGVGSAACVGSAAASSGARPVSRLAFAPLYG